MSFYADIAFGRDTELSQQELNRRAKIIADAIEALREFVPEWEKQVNLLSTLGLERINEALLPAYQQIIDIADLGALLSTTSTTPVTIGVGTKTFLVPEAVRLNFAPTSFLMAVADGDFDQHMVGLLSSYDNETGVLVVQVERVSGEGEFANWQISPVATTDDLEALRQQVAANAQTATEKAGEAVAARNEAVPAGQAAVQALATFQSVWYGPRETEPSGAVLGAQYLDTSQSPNVVKVLTQDGWAPTVTVSVGGSRQQVYVATEGQTGPFVVDGGFSFGSVNVNGAEFFDGYGVTFDYEEGEFTLDAALSAGDVVVFRGYLANDLTDIYTKSETRNFIAANPFLAKALREPFFLWDDIPGADVPDNSGTAKFIRLIAAQSGPGGYNEGLLINEQVEPGDSGLVATAEIAVGPLAGGIVALIGTEGSFLRPGTDSGALQNPSENRLRDFATATSSTGGTNISGYGTKTLNPSGSYTAYGLTGRTDGGFEQGIRMRLTGDETRPKNRKVTPYMRIA